MSERYDVVVIGGGIHGAGVAQAAAVRGYRTLLLEQGGLGSGSSSRSSKLISGGLEIPGARALRLLRESLLEREILLGVAPGLVERRPFFIPLYGDSRRQARSIMAGLWLYRVLVKGPGTGFQRVPVKDWGALDGLRTTGLKAVFRYYDAQTDDLALTHAVARSAQEFGADIRLGARFVGAERAGAGYECRFVQAGSVVSCFTRTLVNATGPWVGQALSRVLPGPPRLPLDLVAGTHILTKGVLAEGVYHVEAPADRRVVSIAAWRGRVLTGTTETLYGADPAMVAPGATDIAYLQETLVYHFPHLSPIVESSFAGLQVRPRPGSGHSGGAFEAILLADSPMPRLLSIVGGRLTTYRRTAERVMDRLKVALPERVAQADTRRLPLPSP